MGQITSTRQLCVYQGATVNLADVLPGLPVQRLYRLTNGNFVSYQVASPQFAAFSTLVAGGIYYVVSSSINYEFAGMVGESDLGSQALPVPTPLAIARIDEATATAYISAAGLDLAQLEINPTPS